MTGAGHQILEANASVSEAKCSASFRANASVSEAKCSASFRSCGLTHIFPSPGLQCRSPSAHRFLQIRLWRRLASHALGWEPDRANNERKLLAACPASEGREAGRSAKFRSSV
eukprot:scaffold35780_cov61-Phaeocystis_antarctica.AAC.5